jgi:hypothetical protein
MNGLRSSLLRNAGMAAVTPARETDSSPMASVTPTNLRLRHPPPRLHKLPEQVRLTTALSTHNIMAAPIRTQHMAGKTKPKPGTSFTTLKA